MPAATFTRAVFFGFSQKKKWIAFLLETHHFSSITLLQQIVIDSLSDMAFFAVLAVLQIHIVNSDCPIIAYRNRHQATLI